MKKRNLVISCTIFVMIGFASIVANDEKQQVGTFRNHGIDVIEYGTEGNGGEAQKKDLRTPCLRIGRTHQETGIESNTGKHGESGRGNISNKATTQTGGNTKEQVNKSESIREKARDRIFSIAPKASAKTSERNERTRIKARYMRNNGMTNTLSRYIIDTCKQGERAQRCVALATHVFIHESGRGKSRASRVHKNPFGLMYRGKHMTFKSRELAFDRWMKTYKKRWYKNTCTTMVTRSKYTTTQKPEWIKNCYHTTKKINRL